MTNLKKTACDETVIKNINIVQWMSKHIWPKRVYLLLLKETWNVSPMECTHKIPDNYDETKKQRIGIML